MTYTEEFFYTERKDFPNSTAIKQAAYDEVEKKLFIQFTSLGEVIYLDVPVDVWQELLDAPSAGGFYNEEIIGNGYSSFSFGAGSVKVYPNSEVGSPADSEDWTEPDTDEHVLTAVEREAASLTAEQAKSIGLEGILENAGDFESQVVSGNNSKYGIQYGFGTAGLTGYYEVNAYNDNTALLEFYSAIQDAEKLFPGVVTNVKVKALVRYFD